MIRLGITGGIGAGKSYVARLLADQFGVPVYDCDRAARRLMTSDVHIRRALTELIGPDAYLPTGELCRSVVARYLFASADHVARVNGIVHPAVRRDILRWLRNLRRRRQPPAVAAVESAIFIEAGLTDIVDRLLVVEAPIDLRIQRVRQRDNATVEQVRQRIIAQISDDERRRYATDIVANDGRDLLPQLSALPLWVSC